MNTSLAQLNLAHENGQISKRSAHNIFGILSILTALAVFEILNYSTTAFALRTLFGNLAMSGINWSSLFAMAIVCMDIAGIICLFMPSAHLKRDPRLFGAWLLAAGLNTWLTWRGISLAIEIQQAQIGWVVDVEVLTRTLPVFMAFLIWLIRVLIIGSLSRPKSSKPESESNLVEPLIFHKESGMQAAPHFDIPSHETTLPFNPVFHSPGFDTIKREPTYRGIPVRYRAQQS